jgi:16S rRNA A1518/A1519 N6-dimethyltransferase RsmA/KsgA/DIM1 with predicted DNA glycosylase/AP lyase activity
VDSAVLAVSNISQKNFTGWGESNEKAAAHFFTIVHAGFAHKRKLLARNLEQVASAENISNVFSELGLSSNTRAEDLSPEVWITLARMLAGK